MERMNEDNSDFGVFGYPSPTFGAVTLLLYFCRGCFIFGVLRSVCGKVIGNGEKIYPGELESVPFCYPSSIAPTIVILYLGWRDPENSGTLLHIAVVEENNFGATITRSLISAGINVNKTDITGETII